MLPPSPWASICRATAWIAKKMPRRLVSTISSQTSGVSSSGRLKTGLMPALATSASTRPKRSTVAATAASTVLGSRTSAASPTAADAALGRRRGDGVGVGVGARRRHHRGARRGEPQGAGAADPAAGAEDDRDLAGAVH